MKRNRARWAVLLAACLGICLGAAPATPSYHAITRIITKIENDWNDLTPAQNPHGAGWHHFFEVVRAELRRFSESADADRRVAALGKLYELSNSLQGHQWDQARALAPSFATG